jgi:hypothetical protein
LGTVKHQGVKPGKPARLINPQVLVWNGNMKVMDMDLASSKPETSAVPTNIADLAKYNDTCLKAEKRFPAASNTANQGPKADGMKQADFAPCSKHRYKFMVRQRARMGSFGSRKKRSEALTHPMMYWEVPNNILAWMDSSVSQALNEKARKAVTMWQEATCLQFGTLKEGNPDNLPHLLFVAKGGPCTSDRMGPNKVAPYATTIDLSNCESIGQVAHAIGHALGLSHSHNRADRDQAVKIFQHNVADTWKSQFEIDPTKYFDDWEIPYYYDSIMQYSAYAASKNGLMTVCPLDPMMEVLMGQREGLAFGDIALANRIYCKESCYNKEKLKTVAFNGDLSKTISDRTCQNWSSQAPHKHGFTSVGNHNHCRNPDNWEGGPWCYTTDPNVPYEPCFPACEDRARRSMCEGFCHNGGYHEFNEECGNCKCPKHTTGPNCENVNASKLHDHITCGRKVVLAKLGDKATLTSKNYPNAYPENRLCVLWVIGPPNSQIRMTFLDFELEKPDDTGCYDYLEIRPSVCATAIEQPEKMRFCGNSLAPNGSTQKQLYSDGNQLVLKFLTDSTEGGKGFKLSAEAVAAA